MNKTRFCEEFQLYVINILPKTAKNDFAFLAILLFLP